MYKILFTKKMHLLCLILVVIGIDFSSKQWVMNNLALHKTMPIMPFLNIFYAKNYGAAFSFLADEEGWQYWFFSGITIIIVMTMLVMVFHTTVSQKINDIAYTLIIGGALSNLVDRVLNGFVVDFIDFYIGSWHFATFNFADCSISIGAMLIVLKGFFPAANKQQEKDRNN